MTALRLASLGLLLLFGCNSSPVPIGPPESAPMNTELVGIWEPILPIEDQDPDMDELLTIISFNENEYYVELTNTHTNPFAEMTTPEDEIFRMRGFLTPVGETHFANLQHIEVEGADKDFLIYQVELSKEDILTTTFVDKNELRSMKSSEELRTFIEDILTSDGIDESDAISYRRKIIFDD